MATELSQNTRNKMLIYQVLPRLFGNNNAINHVDGSIEDNGCGKMSAFTGAILNEIREMGFTHIWYAGMIEHATQTDYSAYGIRQDHPSVVKGKAGSPYAIKDYFDIDPDLADKVENRMVEFTNLINRTHKAGLKAIIDFVPNHVAREYCSDNKPKDVSDLGENDDSSQTFNANNNFYYIPGETFSPGFPIDDYCECPAKVTGNDCFTAHPSRNDWYETVKLNYGVDYMNGGQTCFYPVPDTWKKMLDILLYWASFKIDGFRCDMAEMVPVEFWEWAIPQVKDKYPKLIFIAEVYNPNEYRKYLQKGKFDYLYDKVGLYDTLKDVVLGFRPAREITWCWQALGDIQNQMLNFLENHDEQRIASSFFAGNPHKAFPALFVSALMNKNPFMVYFGQELGEPGMDSEGFSGRDGRTSIFDYWSISSIRNWRNKQLTEEQSEIREYYTRILKLCNESVAIRDGEFYDLMYANLDNPNFDSYKQYAFLRGNKDEVLLIIANFDSKDVDVRVNVPAEAFSYFGIEEKVIPVLHISANDGIVFAS